MRVCVFSLYVALAYHVRRELPLGYGRVKPDVVTHATQLKGADRDGGCMEQSGTSMASPVVAGAIAVIMSSLSPDKRALVVNPGSIKQVLLESAIRLSKANVFEQGRRARLCEVAYVDVADDLLLFLLLCGYTGAGRLSLSGALKLIQTYVPHVSFHPPYYDTTECPYFGPYCDQPLYHSAMPLVFNATIINGMAVTGRLEVCDVNCAAVYVCGCVCFCLTW